MRGAPRLVLATLIAALLAACGPASRHTPDRRKPTPGAPPALARAERTLRSLARERERFIEEQRPEDVFAVFYYHVTDGVIAMARQGKLRHPEFWLDEVEQFHAAYERSRQATTREPHWLPYHARAAAIRGKTLKEPDVAGPGDLLGNPGLAALGAFAHIRGDLPTSLAITKNRHPGLGTGAGSPLAKDFRDLSEVFSAACPRGYGDVARALSPTRPSYLDLLPLRDPVTVLIIRRERERAWHAFISGSS